jgi:hypothetical protein
MTRTASRLSPASGPPGFPSVSQIMQASHHFSALRRMAAYRITSSVYQRREWGALPKDRSRPSRDNRPPLVLSIYLPARDSSSRWKEIVEPSKGRFTHHIELWSERDGDEFVRIKLRETWQHGAWRPTRNPTMAVGRFQGINRLIGARPAPSARALRRRPAAGVRQPGRCRWRAARHHSRVVAP